VDGEEDGSLKKWRTQRGHCQVQEVFVLKQQAASAPIGDAIGSTNRQGDFTEREWSSPSSSTCPALDPASDLFTAGLKDFLLFIFLFIIECYVYFTRF